MSAVLTQAAPSQSSATSPTPQQAKRAKDQAARNRSQQVRSSAPADAASTPGSMETHQERDPAVAARRGPGPENIDYGKIILEIASVENKGNGVKRFVSNKSKQHVFVLACKAVKSILGMEAKDKDGNPTRLPEVHEKALRNALADLHNSRFQKFLSYGGPLETSDANWREDVPVVTVVPKLDAKGQVMKNAKGEDMFDVDFRERMIGTVSRPVSMLSKQLLNLSFKLKAATRKLEHMKSRPGQYDGVDVRKQDKLVTILEAKDRELSIEKGRIAQLEKGIAALDDLLAMKLISKEQYAEKRAEVEAAAAK